MIGIVLSGGESSRMGKDKGLLLSPSGETWARRAFDLLQTVCDQVLVSIHTSQKENYRSHFPENFLMEDDAGLGIKGPLLGLLSAHMRHPNATLLLLACDLVKMKTEVLEHLVHTYKHEPSE